MKAETIVKNWVEGEASDILKNIHQTHVNIAIYNRNIRSMEDEINSLLTQDIVFKSSGNITTILNELTKAIQLDENSKIVQDIQQLLHHFKEVAKEKSFRFLLATVNTNMCRKFHMDVNKLRMLCTYSGPGTLWLTEDNINRKALESYKSNQFIVINESRIQQAKTGAAIILKGAIYPKEGTKAAVHRSPTIEENGEKRLLLRIDTN